MKQKLVIIGTGGHAKVIIDLFQQSNAYELVGCTSADPTDGQVMGVPILGDDSLLAGLVAQGVGNAFIAVGDNRIRDKIAERINKLDLTLASIVSKYAYVSSSVRLGKGVAVMSGVVVNPDSVLEDNVIINTGATIDHDNLIERSVHVAPGANLAGNVWVGKGSFLGIGCKVIPGIRIGEWCTVGAGAVVIEDLPPQCLAVGVPAQIIRKYA
jgi:UDP-perosamine 4-acetyltransferase